MSSPAPIKIRALPPVPAAKLASSAKSDMKKYDELTRQMQISQARLTENERQLEQIRKFKNELIAQQSAESKILLLSHDLLVASLAKAIYQKYTPKSDVTNQLSPAEKQKMISEAAARCKEIVEPYVTESENSNPQTFYKLVMEKQCVRLTTGAAVCLLKVLNDHITALVDLRNFKDEIDQQAITTLLSDGRIKKLVLTKTNQGTDVERFLAARNFPVQYA